MHPQERFDRLRRSCAAHGLRLTSQREALLRVLSRARHHPTADELYAGVRRLRPSISPATVYRNVQQLSSAGVISTLVRPGVTKYDPNPETHHHFVCDACGEVTDIYLSQLSYRLARRSAAAGTRVRRCDVQLSGRCAGCRSSRRQSGGHK